MLNFCLAVAVLLAWLPSPTGWLMTRFIDASQMSSLPDLQVWASRLVVHWWAPGAILYTALSFTRLKVVLKPTALEHLAFAGLNAVYVISWSVLIPASKIEGGGIAYVVGMIILPILVLFSLLASIAGLRMLRRNIPALSFASIAPSTASNRNILVALLFLPVLAIVVPLFVGNESAYTKGRAAQAEFVKLCETAGEKVFRTAPAARSVYLKVDYFNTYREVKDGSYEGQETSIAWLAAENLLRSTALDFVEFYPPTDDDGVDSAVASKLQRLRRGGSSTEDDLSVVTADIAVYSNTLVQHPGDARSAKRPEGHQLIVKDARTGEVLATLRYFVDDTRYRICGFAGQGDVSEEAFLRRVLGP